MRTLFVVVAALATACSTSDSSTPVTPGCSTFAGTCIAGGAMTETACGAQYGTWRAGGCPSANRVGLCALTSGEVVSYYEPWTALSARYDCDGSWMSEPQPMPNPGTGPTTTVSCTIAGVLCIDLTGPMDSSAITSLASDCSGDAYYSYAPAACALPDAVAGHCEVTDAAYPGALARAFYSSFYYTADEARTSCTDPTGTNGTWVAN
jgi:hypothetical protein